MDKSVIITRCPIQLLSGHWHPLQNSQFILSWLRRLFLNCQFVLSPLRRPILNSCPVTAKEAINKLINRPPMYPLTFQTQPWRLSVNFDCPVMALEAVCELSDCPATAMKVACEQSACPVTANDSISELSACPVTAAEAAVNISVLFVPIMPDPLWWFLRLFCCLSWNLPVYGLLFCLCLDITVCW